MAEPKFLYGTHYSTPGYVIGYLVRNNPLYMLKIQSGRFDKPDRLFFSIKNDWKNCYENPAIVKELIPEFYGDNVDFLRNNLDLNLGNRQNGKMVSDVKLPKWAKDANEYLKIQKEGKIFFFKKNLLILKLKLWRVTMYLKTCINGLTLYSVINRKEKQLKNVTIVKNLMTVLRF
jgi:Beige/BEACH domain